MKKEIFVFFTTMSSLPTIVRGDLKKYVLNEKVTVQATGNSSFQFLELKELNFQA